MIARALCVLLFSVSCAPTPPPAENSPQPIFIDVAEAAGLSFVHRNGANGDYLYPELLHAGCAFVDVDDDGLLDLYLVQSGEVPPASNGADLVNRLYRNLGDGRFEDVSAGSGADDPGYGTGVAVGDYDGDGDIDLYITNLGANALLRNDGSGRFTDVTAEAGVGDASYSAAATFGDYDGDGDLDLYVANYLDWSPGIERPCTAPNGIRDYCSPGVYDRPALDTLYRNEGDGRFTDVSREAGVAAARGNGLGVVAADLTGDGLLDYFVANDQMPNHLWVGDGAGRFVEQALVRGVALNASGKPEASMGIAIGDVDNDADWDLFVVHLDGESNTFYRNDGGYFQDATDRLRLSGPSRDRTGFGTGLFDYDCDGDLDLFIANGSVRLGDSMLAGRYEEADQLLRLEADGAYADVSELLADGEPRVSRGAAFGDYDNDGDLDILVNNNDGGARLLRNEQGCAGRRWLQLSLGAGVDPSTVVSVNGRRRLVQPSRSYGSSNDPRVHFGLGTQEGPFTVTIRHADGSERVVEGLEADRIVDLSESAR